jgi:dethiobiotin synthetase
MNSPGLFITGTDTGVGKSMLAGCIVARLRADGVDVRALKPVITGLDDPSDPDWPPDHVLLARAAGCRPEQVIVTSFGPPVSPHFAAKLADRPIDPAAIIRTARTLAADGEALIVEGVGGLLVPIADGYDVRQLAADLALPLLVAARPGLGTINHTLLTLEAARGAGLTVAAVVLTPWPAHPTAMQHSNRETIERLGGVDVWTLPEIAAADPTALAAAGAELPLGSVPSLTWPAAVS